MNFAYVMSLFGVGFSKPQFLKNIFWTWHGTDCFLGYKKRIKG